MSDRAAWYSLRGGRRHVVPYEHVFTSHAKGRWVGQRVFAVMAAEFPAVCTADYLASAAASNRLRVNGRAATDADVFAQGDKLEHIVIREEPSVPDTPLAILHDADGFVALGKPAGIPVHHAGRYRRNTVVEILQAERPGLLPPPTSGKGGLHVVHRIDQHTSGVLLLARSAERARELAALLHEGAVSKAYVARVRGVLPTGWTADARAPIRVASADGATSCDCHPDGKPAHTALRALASDAASRTSLVLATPSTGRTHQIRLHLRHLGHPIDGDPLYDDGGDGGGEAAADAPPHKRARAAADAEEGEKMWLHAWRYACVGAGAVEFCIDAPLPEWATAPFGPVELPAPPALRAAPVPPPAPVVVAPAPVPAPAPAPPPPQAAAAPNCALASEEGARLLAECAPADRAAYDALWPCFARQRGRTACGVASTAMALKALGLGEDDEAAILQRCEGAGAALPRAKIERCGMTLAELGVLLRALEPTRLRATRVHADAADADALVAAARGPGIVLLNYHMTSAGQPPFGGHVSPIGAYHAPSHRLLVLDVWPETEPFWCDASKLHAAAFSVDGESQRARGWVVVRREE